LILTSTRVFLFGRWGDGTDPLLSLSFSLFLFPSSFLAWRVGCIWTYLLHVAKFIPNTSNAGRREATWSVGVCRLLALNSLKTCVSSPTPPPRTLLSVTEGEMSGEKKVALFIFQPQKLMTTFSNRYMVIFRNLVVYEISFFFFFFFPCQLQLDLLE